MNGFIIKPLNEEYRDWAVELLTEHWGSTTVVSRGRIHHTDKLPGFVALLKEEPAGLITYNIDADQCEIVTLNSLVERKGIGAALVKSAKNAAYVAGCKRLWLITTNDNTYAFKFYQKLGFRVAGYHIEAIKESRNLKPGIPYVGLDGIIIRDEIELEMLAEG
jgi:ribosomal protein S18 acetylase RimI-like enzyme